MRNSLLLAALLVATLAPAAAEESGYYKLTPDVAASAWVDSGGILHAEMVSNMPESDIVGAPRSIAAKIEGSCSLREYVITGTALFSGRWRGGYLMEQYESDGLRRRALPRTNIAALFNKECPK